MENGPQDEAELKYISDALHEMYDPVLEEPVPGHLLRARKPRWRGFALAAAWTALGLAVGVVAGWQIRGAGAPAQAVAQAGGVPTFVHRAVVAHVT